MVRSNEKGGIDFAWYAFEIYEKMLLPYLKLLLAINPFKTIYITEDNVGLHHKARLLMQPYFNALGVHFVDWPVNSPDLHVIEPLHND